MKHRTWFRLVLKAIGVLLVGLSAPQAVNIAWALALQARVYMQSGGVGGGGVVAWPDLLLQFGAAFFSQFLQLGFGLYLFFGGKWILNKAIPPGLARCLACGYDVSGAQGETCPECGEGRDEAMGNGQ